MATSAPDGQISTPPMHVLSGPWPARLTWVLLPLLLGPALGDALGDHSLAVARTGSVLAWGTWAVVLVAVLVPRTVSLTALRIAAPTALAVGNWAALATDPGLAAALAVVGPALAVVAAFSPTTGHVFINGSSYGDEVRIPLRVPGALLLGPLPLAGLAAVAGPIAGPHLVAAGQPVAGAAVLLVGVPVAALAVRALHGLARRWLVFVPAGVVLHDHHALVEAVLFPRATVAGIGPAPVEAAGDALDLTQRAFGLALLIELAEPVIVSPRRPDKVLEVVSVGRLLLAATRPGALLGEARRRRLPVA
jgi:hypothetical protein